MPALWHAHNRDDYRYPHAPSPNMPHTSKVQRHAQVRGPHAVHRAVLPVNEDSAEETKSYTGVDALYVGEHPS